jgi:cytochrome c peroxidase
MHVVGALTVCAAVACAHGGPALLGLPVVAYPPDNPSTLGKVALGSKLFFDKGLSADHSISCASCHDPEKLFTDGLPRSEGIRHQLGTRRAPSVINTAFNRSQFWDGRRATLEQQALDPLINPREHGLPDHETALRYVRNDPAYRQLFLSVFGIQPAAITMDHLAKAIASFERTLIAGDSAFDRYYFQGEKSAMSSSAQRGLELFQGRAQCAACHAIERSHALFTDNEFHSLSVGMKRIGDRLAYLTTYLARQNERGARLDSVILDDRDVAELGRFAITLEPADIGKFRTPSLRNVTLRAPYMHDGSIGTLENAVEYELYYRSVERGYPIILTPIEKQDLMEFLKSLTSSPAALAPLMRLKATGNK